MPLWLRFLLFFAVLLVVLVAANAYVHRHTARLLRLERRGRRILGMVLAVGVVTMIAGRAFSATLGQPVSEALAVFGSTIQLGVIISVCLLLLTDAPKGLMKLLARMGRRKVAEVAPAGQVSPLGASPVAQPTQKPSSPTTAGRMPRREFLSQSATGAALIVGGGSSIYGSVFGRHDYQIEEVPIVIPGLATALDGYCIVQLSDIHFGTFVGEPELRSAVALVQKARPDLIVLTGDLVDHDARFATMLGQLVRRLSPLARDGVVAVPGNHDYYADIETVLSALQQAGSLVLRNASHEIGDRGGAFSLVGVDDVWAARNGYPGGPDLDLALSGTRGDVPRILLCHNPVFFPEAADRIDLQLSGHTHGGQVNLVVRPADVVLPYGYVAGLYQRGESQLYVNRGFGTAGPPARVGAPPEVTRIVLVAS